MKRRQLIFVALLVFMLILEVIVLGAAADKVFVVFEELPGKAQEAMVRAAGGRIKYAYRIVPAIAADLPAPAIAKLEANPMVTQIVPDNRVYAIDHELGNSWGVEHIGAGAVHDSNNKGTGTKVAVIDTGMDYNHPDLDANYAGGCDFVNNDADPMDDHGHGTHVAGIIAAEDNDDPDSVVGVAPEVELYALKALDASGSGWVSDIVAAIQWATGGDDPRFPTLAQKVDIINMSLGAAIGNIVLRSACFLAYKKDGLILVAAAGNIDEYGNDKVNYPAAYSTVIAVSATDQLDQRAYFSCIGDEVELSAPGVDVMSTFPGQGYTVWSGTSMASPHVAGTAALVWAAEPELTNSQVRARLQQTADDLGAMGKDSWYGYGLIDADEAVGILPPPLNDPPVVTITSPADGATFASGGLVTLTGTAIDTEDGDISSLLGWISSIDGWLGEGSSVTAVLSDGIHAITASVTDSGGEPGSDSITITVGGQPGPMTVSVIAITYTTTGGKHGDKHLVVTVALEDDLGGPVANAVVSIELYMNGSLDSSESGTTGADGIFAFMQNNAPPGIYTTQVTNVVAADLEWIGGTPDNSFEKSSISSIDQQVVLLQNTPNPFNPETWIPYELLQPKRVVIQIHDMAGRLVRTLDLDHKASGAYVTREKAAYWDGRNEAGEEVSSGIYYYTITADDFSATRKMAMKK